MLKICVCDDSVDFINVFSKQLKSLCKKYFSQNTEYDICGIFNSAQEVLDYMNKSRIDILFLDIDMPEINGFKLSKLVTNINPDIMIVYVSGHDHYVFEVFEFSPFAYLRKTKISEDLPGILMRIDEQALRRNVRLELESIYGHVSVAVKDILYISSDRNYYIVKTLSGKEIRCRGSLTSVEEKLKGCDFFRVHAAYIVNLEYIQSVGDKELKVGECNEAIPISQRKLSAFRKGYATFVIRRFNI